MNGFKLLSGDVLVNINKGKGLYSVIKRWVLGSPYEHVSMYLGKVGITTNWDKGIIQTFPMLFESNGRGVVLQSLSNRYQEDVVVMRARYNWIEAKLPWVIKEAVKLASDRQSYYDYFSIPILIIPRLICTKLGLPIPIKYHRDQFMICSEAVFEVFYRAGLNDILPSNVIPLPEDFVINSSLLEEVGRIKLSEEVV